MGNFYDGTKLLSMKDLNGNKPEIYICTSNRSAGKTTYFSRLFVNRFLDSGEKFCLLYRYSYELTNVADKFFKDIQNLFFPDYDLTEEKRASGKYVELFISKNTATNIKQSCGYAIALNNADSIKKLSHFFSDVKRMLFDEFQSETNNYCPNEILKFISIHTSIARGGGEQSRYVPVYMLSNPVSLINPYYVEFDIVNRLNTNTKFLKGNGFVLEQGYCEGAANAQKNSAFNNAFASNRYLSYASAQSVYLNDSLAFIEEPVGHSRYMCTIRYNGRDFAIREYPASGVIYCDKKADLSFGLRIAVTTDDHAINYVMLKRNELYINTLRYYFNHGCFRFRDLQCKEAVLKLLSY